MVATNLKAEALKLMDRRSALEAEMNGIIDRLCQPGGPGLSGNLVDSEAIHSLIYAICILLCLLCCIYRLLFTLISHIH